MVMAPDKALAFVKDHAVFFERSLDHLPSGDEAQRLKPGTKWSLFGYLIIGQEMHLAAASLAEAQPSEEKITKAYQHVTVCLMNKLGVEKPAAAPKESSIIIST